MSNTRFEAGDIPTFAQNPIPNYHPTALDKMLIVGAVAGAITFSQPNYRLLPSTDDKGEVEQVYIIADRLSYLKKTVLKWEESIPVSEPSRKERLVQDFISQVISFRALDNNWNGYGAIPVSAIAAGASTTVIRLLSEKSLEQISDIFPNANGTVSFKWVNSFGEKVSLCVGVNGMSYYVAKLQQEVSFFDDIDTSPDAIAALDGEILSIVSVNV